MAGSSQINERLNMETNDLGGSTKVVIGKVEKIDPENASKIVGHILFQEHGEQEIMNLAHVSDDMFMSFIQKTREDLNLPPIINRKDKLPTSFTPFIPSSSHFPRGPPVNNVHIDNYAPMIQPVTNNFEYAPVPYYNPPSNVVVPHHHPQLLPMEAQAEYGFHNAPERAWNPGPRGPVLPDMRLYQQHNDNYYPQQEVEERRIPVQQWIKRLEMELVDILKSKGPVPVPIASLPALYSANFGQKVLNVMQARVGCSLHDLLAQMSRRISVMERAFGEPCVILSEDIPRFVKSIEENREREQAADTSSQLYLTFSFQSTFTSQDVYDYFTTFGPVRGVKIPNQPKRMYGFVTFAYETTARIVQLIGNPHFVRGMQVLVKPYRGKQVLDRRSDDVIRFSIWSMTEEDSSRLTKGRLGILPKRQPTIEEMGQSVGIRIEDTAPSRHIPRIRIEDASSSSHIPSFDADAGPNAPRGVSIGSVDKGKCIVTDADEDERYNHIGKSIITDITDVDGDGRYNDKGKGIITDANEEARFNDKGKSSVTDADEEGRYDDLNLPDNPFAFEATAYDFASMIDDSEWDINDAEL